VSVGVSFFLTDTDTVTVTMNQRRNTCQIEDQSRAAKRFKKTGTGKDKSEEGLCTSHSDEEADQSKARPPKAQGDREGGHQRDQEADPVFIKR